MGKREAPMMNRARTGTSRRAFYFENIMAKGNATMKPTQADRVAEITNSAAWRMNRIKKNNLDKLFCVVEYRYNRKNSI